MANILNSVKLFLGIRPEYEEFNKQILMFINAVFNILNQLGVGPEKGFIADGNSTWSDFIDDSEKLEMVKPYVYLKVRLMFDPPTMSYVLDSMSKQINEYEWRLNVQADTKPKEVTENG